MTRCKRYRSNVDKIQILLENQVANKSASTRFDKRWTKINKMKYKMTMTSTGFVPTTT